VKSVISGSVQENPSSLFSFIASEKMPEMAIVTLPHLIYERFQIKLTD
jgi:hypothetical protein